MSRDRTLEDTFYMAFTTRAFSTGVPTALSGSPVVSAYEDGSLTQITAGITLGVDHDSVVGLNMLTIAATAANGYESGKDYNLVITTGTVDSVSVVGEVVGQFSLGLSAAAVDLANGTDGLGAIKSDTAATLLDTAEIGAAGAGLTALATQASVDTVDSNVDAILVDTNDLQTNQGNWLTATGFATSGALATVDSNVDAILIDTNDLQTNQGNWLTATGFATAVDLATVDANVDAVLVDTGTTLPAQLDSMSGATFDTSTDSLEAIRNRGDAAWTTGAGGTPPQLLQATTIATLASQTSFTLTAGSSDDDAYNGAIVVITDSSSSVQKAVGTVSDYTGSTKRITLAADPAIFTMAAGDSIDVIAALGSGTGLTASETRAALGMASADLDTQLDAINTNVNGVQDATVTKNATFSDFTFPMKLSSDHYTAATGKTVTGERSLDAGAFATVSGTIAEVGDGVYQFDALAADTNGDTVTWKFSAADCDDTIVTFKTST